MDDWQNLVVLLAVIIITSIGAIIGDAGIKHYLSKGEKQ